MKRIRDYECRECGLVFDKYTQSTDEVHCPRCNGVDTKSIITAPAFKVTGQGQYSTKMKV